LSLVRTLASLFELILSIDLLDVTNVGLTVTVMFQSCNLSDRYYLDGCHMLWSDFPPNLTHHFQLDERIQLTKQNFPIGTQFKGKIIPIYQVKVD